MTITMYMQNLGIEVLGVKGKIENVRSAISVDVALGGAEVLRDKDEIKDVNSSIAI